MHKPSESTSYMITLSVSTATIGISFSKHQKTRDSNSVTFRNKLCHLHHFTLKMSRLKQLLHHTCGVDSMNKLKDMSHPILFWHTLKIFPETTDIVSIPKNIFNGSIIIDVMLTSQRGISYEDSKSY